MSKSLPNSLSTCHHIKYHLIVLYEKPTLLFTAKNYFNGLLVFNLVFPCALCIRENADARANFSFICGQESTSLGGWLGGLVGGWLGGWLDQLGIRLSQSSQLSWAGAGTGLGKNLYQKFSAREEKKKKEVDL